MFKNFLTRLRQRLAWLIATAAKKIFTRLYNFFDLRDMVALGGLGCVAFGLSQIYVPAAWIISGAALFWLGVRR